MYQQYSQKVINQAKKTRGYLEKKSSGIFSVWQRRYFIILENTLSYYDDESLVQLKKSISLDDINNIKLEDKLQFHIVTKDRVFQLKADEEATRDLWVASLNLLANYKEWNNEKQLKISSKRVSNKSQSKIKKNQDLISPLLKKNVSTPTTKRQKLSSDQLKPQTFFQLVCLPKLSKRWNQESIQNKIIFLRQSKGWYFIISCKTLLHPYLDQDLLNQQLILPYEFNVLYYFDFGKISSPQVLQICQCKNITNVKLQGNKISIYVNKKKLVINESSKNKTSSYEEMLLQKIFSAISISKEYFNDKKIKIKRNIDKMIYQYINKQITIDQIVNKQIQDIIDKKQTSLKQQFRKSIQLFLNNLKQIVDCCQIKDEGEQFKLLFLKTYTHQTYLYIQSMWSNITKKCTLIEIKKVILFLLQFQKYVKQFISQSQLFILALNLGQILIKKYQNQIKTKIDSCFQLNQNQISDQINIQIKCQIQNINKKNTKFLSNNIFRQFHLDIRLILYEFNQMPIHEKTIYNYLNFFKNIFIYIQQKTLINSQKWQNYNTILGACNEIQFIKNGLFQQMIIKFIKYYPNMQQSIFTQFIQNLCDDLDRIQSQLVKKLYQLKKIDSQKKNLSIKFQDIDISAVCKQIRQKLQKIDQNKYTRSFISKNNKSKQKISPSSKSLKKSQIIQRQSPKKINLNKSRGHIFVQQ